MSEEIRKKIEEYIEEAYVGLKETRDDIEFGYHLGYEQAMKEHGKVMQYSTPAAAVQNIHVVTMAPESNEPSQDELWAELDRECIRLSYTGEVFFLTEEAKKRYRITRI